MVIMVFNLVGIGILVLTQILAQILNMILTQILIWILRGINLIWVETLSWVMVDWNEN